MQTVLSKVNYILQERHIKKNREKFLSYRHVAYHTPVFDDYQGIHIAHARFK